MHDGRSVRILNLIDEDMRECLMVRAERGWSSATITRRPGDVMVRNGVPEHLRSDNGSEFVAKDLCKWLAKTGAKTLYIEPGSPCENGFCESLQLEAQGGVPERRNLVLDEGTARAG